MPSGGVSAHSDRVGRVPTTARAPALPPEERRAMLVSATLSLLSDHGQGITTRQIAEAAGVAEGTIFRAFPDKESLIDAAIEAAFDPASLEVAIAAIPPNLVFEQRLAQAVGIMQRRHAEIWRLVSNIGNRPSQSKRPLADIAALAELLSTERARLTKTPLTAARLLRALTLASSPPLMAEPGLTAREIVSLFLDGVRKPSGRRGTTRC